MLCLCLYRNQDWVCNLSTRASFHNLRSQIGFKNIHETHEYIWPVQSKTRLYHDRHISKWSLYVARVCFFFSSFKCQTAIWSQAWMIPSHSFAFFSSFLCDWINYVSLTLLEVSKHTFSVISHQSMWPWRWKVKHVSQEAGQRGIRQLISGPTQSHHSTLPWELKLSLLAMYSEL